MNNEREKEILIMANKARSFLYVHGFLAFKENEKITKRVSDYQDKHKIEVTAEELNQNVEL